MVIYKITNILDGKFYIGSTANFKQRKSQHFTELRCNRHGNPRLQNAFNKYGEENFIIEILEEVDGQNSLIPREQFYIDSLKPFYNIRKIADRNTGIRFTYDTPPPRARKTVIQYDKEFNFIKEWSSGLQASKDLNIPCGAIFNCCVGRNKTYKGFIFKYKDNFIPYKSKTGLTHAQSSRLNGEKSAKTYKITYKNGKQEIFINFSKYCREHNLDRGVFKSYIGKNTMDRLGFELRKVNNEIEK